MSHFEKPNQKHVIGIVGGLGPYAHITFERYLLGAMTSATRDQDYPAWIVSSLPQIVLAEGLSSVTPMLESVRRLAAADFAVIACNTAHLYFDELESQSPIPLLHMIEEVVHWIVENMGHSARVGVLGVSLTVEGQLYPRVAQSIAPGLEWLRLHDLENGQHLHETLTMRPIYGRLSSDGRRDRSGIKDGSDRDRVSGRSHREALTEAVSRLRDAGADCVIAGCTEISAAFADRTDAPSRLVDPLLIAADATLSIAFGDRDLPRRRGQ